MVTVTERPRPGAQSIPDEKRRVHIAGLVLPDEKRSLEALAERARLSVSALVREAVVRLLNTEARGE